MNTQPETVLLFLAFSLGWSTTVIAFASLFRTLGIGPGDQGA